MSYCRWLECDLYAYQAMDSGGSPLFVVHVAATAADRFGLEREYRESDAEAFLDRLLWLEKEGCTLVPDAVEELRREIGATSTQRGM